MALSQATQQPQYDVRHYDLSLRPDFQNKTLAVTARVKISNPTIEIGVETAEGMHVERIMLDRPRVTVELETVQRPTGFVLDPRGWLLLNETRTRRATGSDAEYRMGEREEHDDRP
ncbi:MAG: hypothetical protein ACE5O2_02815 [Armatimonadota bacterium]